MLAAPTWYRWIWSTTLPSMGKLTLPGVGKRGRPGAVAVSARVSCRLGRWMCMGEEPSENFIALVQIMAWCLFGAKASFQPMLAYCYLPPYKQPQWKFDLNALICIQEGAHENALYKMASILSRSHCVNLAIQESTWWWQFAGQWQRPRNGRIHLTR